MCGLLVINTLNIMLNIVKPEYGMISNAPASVYGILNLFTSKSFRLSIKPPKLTSEKKEATIKTQNIAGIILSSLILKEDYYYAFTFFVY